MIEARPGSVKLHCLVTLIRGPYASIHGGLCSVYTRQRVASLDVRDDIFQGNVLEDGMRTLQNVTPTSAKFPCSFKYFFTNIIWASKWKGRLNVDASV